MDGRVGRPEDGRVVIPANEPVGSMEPAEGPVLVMVHAAGPVVVWNLGMDCLSMEPVDRPV